MDQINIDKTVLQKLLSSYADPYKFYLYMRDMIYDDKGIRLTADQFWILYDSIVKQS